MQFLYVILAFILGLCIRNITSIIDSFSNLLITWCSGKMSDMGIETARKEEYFKSEFASTQKTYYADEFNDDYYE